MQNFLSRCWELLGSGLAAWKSHAEGVLSGEGLAGQLCFRGAALQVVARRVRAYSFC